MDGYHASSEHNFSYCPLPRTWPPTTSPRWIAHENAGFAAPWSREVWRSYARSRKAPHPGAVLGGASSVGGSTPPAARSRTSARRVPLLAVHPASPDPDTFSKSGEATSTPFDASRPDSIRLPRALCPPPSYSLRGHRRAQKAHHLPLRCRRARDELRAGDSVTGEGVIARAARLESHSARRPPGPPSPPPGRQARTRSTPPTSLAYRPNSSGPLGHGGGGAGARRGIRTLGRRPRSAVNHRRLPLPLSSALQLSLALPTLFFRAFLHIIITMIARVATAIVALAAATAVGATAIIPRSSCSTGELQCCNSVEKANSGAASKLVGLLGIVLQNPDVLVGLTCDPISVLGVGGSSCSAHTVCCENNSFGSLISIGCMPVDLS